MVIAAILGLILLISGPSMIIAGLKLRQRTLGPILDGNGWAVNGRVRINIPFGTSLTARAALPPGAQRTLDDPFAEKRSPWPVIIGVFLVLAAAAIWIRWDHNKRGYYRWQSKPVEVAPATPPPEAAPAAPPAAPN
jgi:hypothetical protein